MGQFNYISWICFGLWIPCFEPSDQVKNHACTHKKKNYQVHWVFQPTTILPSTPFQRPGIRTSGGTELKSIITKRSRTSHKNRQFLSRRCSLGPFWLARKGPWTIYLRIFMLYDSICTIISWHHDYLKLKEKMMLCYFVLFLNDLLVPYQKKRSSFLLVV